LFGSEGKSSCSFLVPRERKVVVRVLADWKSGSSRFVSLPGKVALLVSFYCRGEFLFSFRSARGKSCSLGLASLEEEVMVRDSLHWKKKWFIAFRFIGWKGCSSRFVLLVE